MRGVLSASPANAALAELRLAAAAADHYAALNGLSLTLLKYTSPGVPDIYQGCELIDRSLVDPDNRRAVDFELRLRRLESLQALAAGPDLAAAVSRLAEAAPDGGAKLWVIHRLLALRAQDPELFRDGSYEPLEVRGVHQRHLVAFLRRRHRRVLVVIALRLFATLDRGAGRWPASVGGPLPSPLTIEWTDTEILLPPGVGVWRFEDCLSGAHHAAKGRCLRVAPVLRAFPGAALVALADAPAGVCEA